LTTVSTNKELQYKLLSDVVNNKRHTSVNWTHDAQLRLTDMLTVNTVSYSSTNKLNLIHIFHKLYTKNET